MFKKLIKEFQKIDFDISVANTNETNNFRLNHKYVNLVLNRKRYTFENIFKEMDCYINPNLFKSVKHFLFVIWLVNFKGFQHKNNYLYHIKENIILDIKSGRFLQDKITFFKRSNFNFPKIKKGFSANFEVSDTFDNKKKFFVLSNGELEFFSFITFNKIKSKKIQKIKEEANVLLKQGYELYKYNINALNKDLLILYLQKDNKLEVILINLSNGKKQFFTLDDFGKLFSIECNIEFEQTYINFDENKRHINAYIDFKSYSNVKLSIDLNRNIIVKNRIEKNMIYSRNNFTEIKGSNIIGPIKENQYEYIKLNTNKINTFKSEIQYKNLKIFYSKEIELKNQTLKQHSLLVYDNIYYIIKKNSWFLCCDIETTRKRIKNNFDLFLKEVNMEMIKIKI